MKNYMRLLPIFAALSGLLVAGCATDAPATVSAQAPPLPKVETIGIAPGPLYDWVPGYWAFKDGQWDWIPGSWQGRPRPNAVWVAGHWDQTAGNSWTWTPGRWQN